MACVAKNHSEESLHLKLNLMHLEQSNLLALVHLINTVKAQRTLIRGR